MLLHIPVLLCRAAEVMPYLRQGNMSAFVFGVWYVIGRWLAWTCAPSSRAGMGMNGNSIPASVAIPLYGRFTPRSRESAGAQGMASRPARARVSTADSDSGEMRCSHHPLISLMLSVVSELSIRWSKTACTVSVNHEKRGHRIGCY